ncbi:hypothetical protein ABZ547_38835 [Streptomyces sparsogenes]|uniref:hypothetical protein n=1 Tax=Streptomyces sparsogenes TaxID=67365 RepID=UPI0033E3DC9B
MEEWERRHRTLYGEDAWRRVLRGAWTLTAWTIGYDRNSPPQDRGSAAQTARERTWLPAAALLALALWRAGRDADVLVDDVPLDRALWWLGGARHGELHAAPYPDNEPVPMVSWSQLAEREGALLDPAREVVQAQVLAAVAEDRLLGETPDAAGRSPIVLGDRVRALDAAGLPGGAPPWQLPVDYASTRIREAGRTLEHRWTPRPEERWAARTLHQTLTALPDMPDLRAPADAAALLWVQRARHLIDVATTIRVVQDEHPDTLRLRPDMRPYARALQATDVALRDIGTAAHDLEWQWARRPDEQSIAAWERQHFPRPLRAHVQALEDLLATLTELTYAVAQVQQL